MFMRKKILGISYASFVLGLILLLSFFFRFYNFHHLLFFGMDQEYEAFLAKNILSGQHFPLIGVNASDTGLYLGPAFIYFATIPFALFGGNPIGWGITASLLGVITTFLIYRIGKSLFSNRIGLLSSFFYAASFLVSYYDRNFWNPSPVAFLSIVMGYLIIKFSEKIPKYMPLLFFVFSLGIQCHLSLVLFLPFILFIVWRERKRIKLKTLLLSLGIFTLLHVPLIFFELRHNFINSRALIHLATSVSDTQSLFTIGERGTILVASVARFLWIPASSDMFVSTGQCTELPSSIRNPPPEIILTGLIILAIFLRTFFGIRMDDKKKSQYKNEYFSYVFIYRLLLITLFIVVFFSRALHEYYFLYFFPYLSLIFAIVLDHLLKNKNSRLIGFFILFIFLLHNLISLFTSYSSYSYPDKIDALNFAKKFIGKNSYSLEALGECPRFGGYRYLSEYVVGTPNSSYMDGYFSWLYPQSIKKEIPKYTVLFSLIDPRSDKQILTWWQEKKYQYLARYTIAAQKQFNSIQLLILTPRL